MARKPNPTSLPKPYGRTRIASGGVKPVLCVNDQQGHPVLSDPVDDEAEYLGWNSGDGRFYAVRTKRKGQTPVYFGKDLPQAIAEFRQWVDNRDRKILTFLQMLEQPDGKGGGKARVYRMPLNVFWDRVRLLLLEHPDHVADKTGIDAVRRLRQLPKPKPSATLDRIGRAYLEDKRDSITPKEWANSKKWWREFIRITEANRVSNLDLEAFRGYRRSIKTARSRGKKSAVYVRSRFGKIKAIINHALDELDLSPSDRTTLDLRKLLKPPAKPRPNPLDLTRRELAAILKVSDDWQKALILLALNAAYTQVDCRRLTWDRIDFRKKTIRFDRSKSEQLSDRPIPRICSLWARTIAALRKVPAKHDHVFVLTKETPVHSETIRRAWNDLCERARIKRRITFKHLRSSALTAASNDSRVPDRHVDLLAGHSCKIKDHYVVRSNVVKACDAVEKHYFG